MGMTRPDCPAFTAFPEQGQMIRHLRLRKFKRARIIDIDPPCAAYVHRRRATAIRKNLHPVGQASGLARCNRGLDCFGQPGIDPKRPAINDIVFRQSLANAPDPAAMPMLHPGRVIRIDQRIVDPVGREHNVKLRMIISSELLKQSVSEDMISHHQQERSRNVPRPGDNRPAVRLCPIVQPRTGDFDIETPRQTRKLRFHTVGIMAGHNYKLANTGGDRLMNRDFDEGDPAHRRQRFCVRTLTQSATITRSKYDRTIDQLTKSPMAWLIRAYSAAQA